MLKVLCAFDLHILVKELLGMSPALYAQLGSFVLWVICLYVVLWWIGFFWNMFVYWRDPVCYNQKTAFRNVVSRLPESGDEWTVKFSALVDAEYNSIQEKRRWWHFFFTPWDCCGQVPASILKKKQE